MKFRLKLSELRNLTWKTLKKRSEQLSVAQNEILSPARPKKFSILRCYGAPKDISESFIISTLSERIWNASFEFCDTYYQVYGS